MNFIVTIPQNSGLRRRRSAPSRIGASPRPPKTFRTPDAAGPVALLCLREAGLAPEKLLAAIAIAARHKTTPEQVVLKEGWIGEADYYERLSDWLDMPLLAAPIATGPGAVFPHSILSGLAPGPQWTGDRGAIGRRWIAAPEGAQIVHLAQLRANGFALEAHFALAPRRCCAPRF